LSDASVSARISFESLGSSTIRDSNNAPIIADHPAIADRRLFLSVRPEAVVLSRSIRWRTAFVITFLIAFGARAISDPSAA
jgi:hypothetical protein